MKETDRSRDRSDEEETSPGATRGRERIQNREGQTERKRERERKEELKEVMKIRRSRKGAYDMRMRRSTRKTGALILDLVTLTPAGVPLPAYYTRLRTHAVAGEGSAKRTLRSVRRLSHAQRDAYPTCTSRSCTSSLTHGCEMRDGCLPGYYARLDDTHDVRKNRRMTSRTPPLHMSICVPPTVPEPGSFNTRIAKKRKGKG